MHRKDLIKNAKIAPINSSTYLNSLYDTNTLCFPEYDHISGCVPEAMFLNNFHESIQLPLPADLSFNEFEEFEERPRVSEFSSAMPNPQAVTILYRGISSLQEVRILCDRISSIENDTKTLTDDTRLSNNSLKLKSFPHVKLPDGNGNMTSYLAQSLFEFNANILLAHRGFEGNFVFIL